MPSGKNAHIFIVDDDADDREFIVTALLEQGFQGNMAEFENGKVLTEYLRIHPDDKPNLILLDLNMPVKNGYETLRELKEDESRKHIPVIVFSATTKKEDEQYCLKSGCSHFLNKPYDLEGYNDVAKFVQSFFYDANLT